MWFRVLCIWFDYLCLMPLSTILQVHVYLASVLLLKNRGSPKENHGLLTSHSQSLSHKAKFVIVAENRKDLCSVKVKLDIDISHCFHLRAHCLVGWWIFIGLSNLFFFFFALP